MRRDPFAFVLVIVLAFVCVMVLGGCGAYPTLEELEDEAMRTGDWSLVERREERQAIKNMHSAYVEYCQSLRGSYLLLCAGPIRTKRDIERACQCVQW